MPLVQVEGNLDCGAGIKRGPQLARESRARKGRGALQRTVAAQELGSVAGHAPGHVIGVEKRDSVGEFRAVGVAREKSAGAGVGVGDHMRGRLRALGSQHPFHVGGSRQPAWAARIVAQLQHGELHRRVHVHVDPQLRVNAALAVLEDAVAEAVPSDGGMLW